MLKLKVGGPRVLGGARRTYALVASQYNPEYVQALVDHAAKELMRLVPSARLILHQVPGAFEIPLVVQELPPSRATRSTSSSPWASSPGRDRPRRIASVAP